ncbi:MAG TPA: hypothetical protein ENJ60_00895 [Aeromonadales bacterium]|nr:hypothetical protein [Aeromonadales bacterium]
MSDLHLDDFRKDAAITLLRLYNNFPREHSLYVVEICAEETTDEFGLPSKRHEACQAGMLWLARHGLMSYGQVVPDEGIELAVLTPKGLQLLLSADDNKKPRIENLRAAIKSCSSEKIEKVMNALLLSIPSG